MFKENPNSYFDVGEASQELVHPGEGVSRVELPATDALPLLKVRVHSLPVLLKAAPVG